MTRGGALGQHVGELQRRAAQLERPTDELAHYPPSVRVKLAASMREVIARLDLVRSAVEPDVAQVLPERPAPRLAVEP